MRALLFDCDGVLVDTERDGHRVAFNRAFTEFGLQISWDEKIYGDLLGVAGGKERMRHYFDSRGWPAQADDRDDLVRSLHARKTDLFMELIETGRLPLRPGVERLVDEAIAAGVILAVCSTSNERAVTTIVRTLLGPDRGSHFSIFAGDMVSRKKPAPDIYRLASERLGVEPSQCVVIEDSRNGLLAARSAGMPCVVTRSSYTHSEDFTEADLVLDELGEDPSAGLTLTRLQVLFPDELS